MHHTFTAAQETFLASVDDAGKGPTLSEAQANYSGTTFFDPTDNEDFQVIDGYQWLRIPYTGIYEFRVDGASGGINRSFQTLPNPISNQWMIDLWINYGMLFEYGGYVRSPGARAKFRIKLFENQWIGMVVGQSEDCDTFPSDNIASASGGGGSFLFSAFDGTYNGWHVNSPDYGDTDIADHPADYMHIMKFYQTPYNPYEAPSNLRIHPIAVAGGAGGLSFNIGNITVTDLMNGFSMGGKSYEMGGTVGHVPLTGIDYPTTSQSGIGYGSTQSHNEPNMASGGAGWMGNASENNSPHNVDFYGNSRPESISSDDESSWDGGHTAGLIHGAKGSRKTYLANLKSLYGGFGGGGCGEGSEKGFNEFPGADPPAPGIVECGGGGGFTGGSRTNNQEKAQYAVQWEDGHIIDSFGPLTYNSVWNWFGEGGGSWLMKDMGLGEDFKVLDLNNLPIEGLPQSESEGYVQYPYDSAGYGIGSQSNGNRVRSQGAIKISHYYIPAPPDTNKKAVDGVACRWDIDLDIESGGIKWGNGEVDWWRSQTYDTAPLTPLEFAINNEGQPTDSAVITLGWFEKQTIAYNEVTTIKAKRESEDESAWRILFNGDPDTTNPPAVPGTCYNYYNLGNNGPDDTVEWTEHFISFEFPLTDGQFNPDFPPGDDWVFSVERNQASDLTWPVVLKYNNYDDNQDDIIISEDIDEEHWGSEKPKIETILTTSSQPVPEDVPYIDSQEPTKLNIDENISPTSTPPKDDQENSELEIITQLETIIQAIKHIYSNVNFDADGVPENIEAKKSLEKSILKLDQSKIETPHSPKDDQEDTKLKIDTSPSPSLGAKPSDQEKTELNIDTDISPTSTPPILDDNEDTTIVRTLDSLLTQIEVYKKIISKTEFDTSVGKDKFYPDYSNKESDFKISQSKVPSTGSVHKEDEKTELNLSSSFPDDLFEKLSGIDNTEDSKLILNSYLLASMDIINKLKTNVAFTRLATTLIKESKFANKDSILELDQNIANIPLYEWLGRKATTTIELDDELSPEAKDKLKDKTLDVLKVIDGMQTPVMEPGIKDNEHSQLKILTSILTILNFRPQILSIIDFDYNATVEEKRARYSKEKSELLLSSTTEPRYYDLNRTKEFDQITIEEILDPSFKDKIGQSENTFLVLASAIEQAFGDWLDTAREENITIEDNTLDEFFAVAYSSFLDNEETILTINGEMLPTHHDTQYVYKTDEKFVLSEVVDKTMFALKKLLSIVDLDASPSVEKIGFESLLKADSFTIEDAPLDSTGQIRYNEIPTDLKTYSFLYPFLGQLIYNSNDDSTKLSISQSIMTSMGLFIGKGKASLTDFIKSVSVSIDDPDYVKALTKLITADSKEQDLVPPKDDQENTKFKIDTNISPVPKDPIKEPIPTKLNLLDILLQSLDPVFNLLDKLDFDFSVIEEEWIGEFKKRLTELKTDDDIDPDTYWKKVKDQNSETNIGEVLNPFLGSIETAGSNAKLKIEDTPQEDLGSILFRNEKSKLILATNFLAFIGKTPKPLDIISYVFNIISEISEAETSVKRDDIKLMDNALSLEFATWKETIKDNIDISNLKINENFEQDYEDPEFDNQNSKLTIAEDMDPDDVPKKSSSKLSELIISSQELKEYHDKESEKRQTKLQILENIIDVVNSLKRYASVVDIDKSAIVDKHDAYNRYRDDLLKILDYPDITHHDTDYDKGVEKLKIVEGFDEPDRRRPHKKNAPTNLRTMGLRQPSHHPGKFENVPDTLTLFEILYASFRAVRDSISKVDIQASESFNILDKKSDNPETILHINSAPALPVIGGAALSKDLISKALIENISEITSHVLEKMDQLQYIDSMLNAVVILDEDVGRNPVQKYKIPFADKQIGSVGGKTKFPWRINTYANIDNVIVGVTDFTPVTEAGVFIGLGRPLGTYVYQTNHLARIHQINSLVIEYITRAGKQVARENRISIAIKKSELGEIIPIFSLDEGENAILPLGNDIWNSGIPPQYIYIKAQKYSLHQNNEQYGIVRIRAMGTL